MRFLCVFFFFFSLGRANAFAQTIANNPDFPRDSCPYNIIFVLDESGSISGTRQSTSFYARSIIRASQKACFFHLTSGKGRAEEVFRDVLYVLL